MFARDVIFGVCVILLLLMTFYLAYENYELHKRLWRRDGNVTVDQPNRRVFVVWNDNTINRRGNVIEEEDVVPERGLTYFDEMARGNHNNDKQNSHNSQTLRDLEVRWKILIELNDPKPDPEIQEFHTWEVDLVQTAFREMRSAVADVGVSDKDRQKMLKVLEVAEKGQLFGNFKKNSEAEDYGTREDWILTQIWTRIQAPANDSNRSQLLTAFTDQLKDASKDVDRLGATIINQLANAIGVVGINMHGDEIATECMTGRVQRYFQIFTLLDNDSLLAAPIKDEKEYENEAYMKSYTILQQELDRTGLHDLYDRQEEELDLDESQQLAEFKQSVKTRIEEELRVDYHELIPSELLESTITKCIAGV
jgi:hypothetical protein